MATRRPPIPSRSLHFGGDAPLVTVHGMDREGTAGVRGGYVLGASVDESLNLRLMSYTASIPADRDLVAGRQFLSVE